MTDNEIIKALECCSDWENEETCKECPFYEELDCATTDRLDKYALDLINRQKKRIKELEERLTEKMIDIAGYEGLYAVTDCGKVWSYRKSVFLKPFLARGYCKVRLYKDGENKQFLIHRLVADSFLPNPNGLPQINHKDENKRNNCVDNLEWCDTKYNINYGSHNENVAKSHCKKVYCVELDRVFESAKFASMQLGVSDSNIAKCCKGKYKTTGGYHWKYADDTFVKEMAGEDKVQWSKQGECPITAEQFNAIYDDEEMVGDV